MQVGEKRHGFTVTRVRRPVELGADVVEMVYEKTGTQLVFLDREDENRSFGIAFRTVPEDDTGVFHIIEHSVLCGSDKYPVKEPFVELLKSSLNTFLNAMTYNDKTVYPVASTNMEDFFHLVDVYVDAVLHPAILHRPEIFRQEGWHYEIGEDGAPTVSGVVFNEMKGAYSSVEDFTEEQVMTALFPDNCYGRDSGGNPAAIPDLTYEAFVAAHQKFYHPSNARIFADGSVDIDRLLALLDGYLCAYEKAAELPPIAPQAPFSPKNIEVPYEIADDDGTGKVRVVFGYLGFPYTEKRAHVALSVVASVLADNNNAPLKKALLDRGLCEDVTVNISTGALQSYFTVEVLNTEKDKIEDIRKTVAEVFAEAAAHLDAKRLAASLNNREFFLREHDFRGEPRGIIYGLSMLETWLYGGDPLDALTFEDDLAFLREHLTDGYFEEQVRRAFVDNPSRVTLTLLPSRTLAAERAEEESARILAKLAPFDTKKRKQIQSAHAALKAFQEKPDTKEALATLPHLRLCDLSPEPDRVPTEVRKVMGQDVLFHEVKTDGILYADMYFDVSDLSPDLIPYLPPLCAMIGSVGTATRSALDVRDRIRGELGFFTVAPKPVSKIGETERARLLLRVSAGVLESRFDSLPDIVNEVLTTSVLPLDELEKTVRQMKIEAEEDLSNAGHVTALTRIGAYLSAEGFLGEELNGYDAFLWLAKNAGKNLDTVLAGMNEIYKTAFTRGRVTLSLTGKCTEARAAAILSALPAGGEIPAPMTGKKTGKCQEGIVTPSQTSYVVTGGFGGDYHGSMAVGRQLLSYEYLWNRVRVVGGAYGAGLIARQSGLLGTYSYRDPKPKNTLAVSAEMSDFLRAFLDSGDLEPYIIGASAKTPLTPRLSGMIGDNRYLRGISYADECRWRKELLHTTAEDLYRLGERWDKTRANPYTVIVGDRKKLETVAGLTLLTYSEIKNQ